ncbi:MAG: hypothetical protein JNJ45_07235 [Chthonomonas sp.]|nr:hypothetical protein [Chthonomonas sp.]
MNSENTFDNTQDVNRSPNAMAPTPDVPNQAQTDNRRDQPAGSRPQYGEDFDYDQADSHLKLFETDYRRFEEENATQPKEWWDESKRAVRAQMEELRANLNRMKDNAPDAWGEMRDSIGAALGNLGDGYRKAVRELNEQPNQRPQT